MNIKMKSALCLLTLFSGAPHAAEVYYKEGAKLDLYGKLDARHTFSDDDSQDGDQTYARFGFKGSTEINNKLTGFGQAEFNFQANHSEAEGIKGNSTRLGFAGLKYGDWGSIDYGRNYGAIYDIEAFTDRLPVFGGDSYTRTDNFMNQRGNNLFTYRNSGAFGFLEGLQVTLQYQGKNGGAGENSSGRSSFYNQNGEGFGSAIIYNFESGVSIGAAYANSRRTDDQIRAGHTLADIASGERAEVWTSGVKYDTGTIYLAAMYAETRNMTSFGRTAIADKTQNMELTAQYQFLNGLRPSLGWVFSTGKDLNADVGSKQTLKNYIDAGVIYYLNKNFSTYADYKINLMSENDLTRQHGLSTDDIVGVGFNYQF